MNKEEAQSGRCHSCKHWDRSNTYDWPKENMPLKVGTCVMVEGSVNYFDIEDIAERKIADGGIGGHNVFTNENFGCINYEAK